MHIEILNIIADYKAETQIIFANDSSFGLVKGSYEKQQPSHQQCGLDYFVDVINFDNGRHTTFKLYETDDGSLYFKPKLMDRMFICDFYRCAAYTPLQYKVF